MDVPRSTRIVLGKFARRSVSENKLYAFYTHIQVLWRVLYMHTLTCIIKHATTFCNCNMRVVISTHTHIHTHTRTHTHIQLRSYLIAKVLTFPFQFHDLARNINPYVLYPSRFQIRMIYHFIFHVINHVHLSTVSLRMTFTYLQLNYLNNSLIYLLVLKQIWLANKNEDIHVIITILLSKD